MEGIGIISGIPVKKEGRKIWQYLACVSASLLALGAGSVLAWTSPIIPMLTKPDSHITVNIKQLSWIASLVSIGAIIGAVPAGILADSLGRKKTILATSVPYLLSWGLILVAKNAYILYLARTLAGISVGLTCVVVPIYIAEIAEPSVRGVLGSLFQLSISGGILYGFVVGAFVSYTWLAIICALIEVLFIATFIWMPESPQWLVSQRLKVEAIKALGVFRGKAYDINGELAALQITADEAARRRSSFANLVNTQGARKALFAGLGALAFQQLTGINAVIFYTTGIFEAAGTSMHPTLASIIVSLVQTLVSGVAALIVDRVGRRMLLISSSAVLAICLFFLGLYFQFELTQLGWLPLLSLALFMVAFSLGYGPVPWMLMGELFPPETKGTASVIAVIINWTSSFLVTIFYSTFQQLFGIGITFWIFTGIMITATIFGIAIVPETKGKSLQQIQDELHGRNRNGPPM